MRHLWEFLFYLFPSGDGILIILSVSVAGSQQFLSSLLQWKLRGRKQRWYKWRMEGVLYSSLQPWVINFWSQYKKCTKNSADTCWKMGRAVAMIINLSKWTLTPPWAGFRQHNTLVWYMLCQVKQLWSSLAARRTLCACQKCPKWSVWSRQTCDPEKPGRTKGTEESVGELVGWIKNLKSRFLEFEMLWVEEMFNFNQSSCHTIL